MTGIRLSRWCCVLALLLMSATGQEQRPLEFLCIPHWEPAYPSLPSAAEIAEFCETWRSELMNRAPELEADPLLARQVMGQTSLLGLVRERNQALVTVPVRVHFVPPSDWLNRISDRAKGSGDAFLAGAGDTYPEDFKHRGWVAFAVPFFDDLRLVFYDKRVYGARSTAFATASAFAAAADRLHKKLGLAALGLAAPRDPNVLWLSRELLLAAGTDILAGNTPGSPSALNTPQAKQVCDWLFEQVAAGQVQIELGNGADVRMLDRFLAGVEQRTKAIEQPGGCAAIVGGPWVAAEAERRGLLDHLGVALLPPIGDYAGPVRTWMGGTDLVVLRPPAGTGAYVNEAQEFATWLTSAEVQARFFERCQFLPAAKQAWDPDATRPYRFRTLYEELRSEAVPSPQLYNWVDRAESAAVSGHLCRFYSLAAGLAGSAEDDPAVVKMQRAAALSAWEAASEAIDAPLGTQRIKGALAILIVLAIVLSLALVASRVSARRATARQRALQEQANELRSQLALLRTAAELIESLDEATTGQVPREG